MKQKKETSPEPTVSDDQKQINNPVVHAQDSTNSVAAQAANFFARKKGKNNKQGNGRTWDCSWA